MIEHPRQWVVETRLKTLHGNPFINLAEGEEISCEIVVEVDSLDAALERIYSYVAENKFEVLDILNAEILVPRSLSREHRDIELGILSASTQSRDDGIAFGRFVGEYFYSTHPRAWIVSCLVEALPSYTGERDDRDLIFYCDALVYCVREETAKAIVKDEMLLQDFEVKQFVRCELFDEYKTERILSGEINEWGAYVEFDYLYNSVDDFLLSKKTAIGQFIWPEEAVASFLPKREKVDV